MVLVACCFAVLAQMPQQFVYVGETTNGPTIQLLLRLYTNDVGGVCLFEDSNTVQVADGYYSALVGDTPTTGTLSEALGCGEVYIEPVVNGAPEARELLHPNAYALVADGVLQGKITSAMIATGAIQQAHIQSGAIQSAHISEGAVSYWQIQNGTVGTNDLNVGELDGRFVNVTGDTLAGDINLGGKKIGGVATITFANNPPYISGPVLSNYYTSIYINNGRILTSADNIDHLYSFYSLGGGWAGNYGLSWLKLRSVTSAGATWTTNYTASFYVTSNVVNEIRVTGHFNMQGSAISNGVFVGNGSALYVLPQGGLSMGTFTNGLP